MFKWVSLPKNWHSNYFVFFLCSCYEVWKVKNWGSKDCEVGLVRAQRWDWLSFPSLCMEEENNSTELSCAILRYTLHMFTFHIQTKLKKKNTVSNSPTDINHKRTRSRLCDCDISNLSNSDRGKWSLSWGHRGVHVGQGQASQAT